MKRRRSLVPVPSRPPAALRGFAHINRYFDTQARKWVAQVLPGEYYVTRQDEVIATVLGSCVATCVRDEVAGVGGINHFMLPNGEDASREDALRYGSHAVARLLGELVKYGARPERMEVKVFGGGRVIDSASDIGLQNVEYTRRYFAGVAMPIVAEDTRGAVARRVRYFPATGKAMVQHFETREPIALEAPVWEPTIPLTSETRLRSAGPIVFIEGEARDDTRVDSRRLGPGSEAADRAHLAGPGVHGRRRGT